LGLLLADTGSYGAESLPLHQWTGISTLFLSLVSAWYYRSGRRNIAKFFLITSCFSVLVTGHLGAGLTHGEDYLTEVLPTNNREEGVPAESAMFNLASMKGPLSESQVQELNFQVRTIFAHNCYSCHGAGKVKGELRLDKKEFIFEGGEHGAVIIPGDPANSEMIRRVKLPRSDKEAMPGKGKALSQNDIATLEYWIKQGAPWPAGQVKSLYRTASLEPRKPELPPASGIYDQPIDRFVNQYFTSKKIKWPTGVDDRVYIRRVYLDVIGLIPPADSIDAFVADRSPVKREQLVFKLLSREHDYSQHWLSIWNDLLRNDYTGTGYITGGRFDISNWLYNSLVTNKPYDQFVKQLISPDSSSQGFVRGIQWRGSVNSSQSIEMQAAQNVSQVFLGLNLKCASCHDSFISDWKLDDAYAFANLFSDSILQIYKCDKPTGRYADRKILYPELGSIDSNISKKQRLAQLAEKLVQPKDGRLYRTLVNRIWAQLFGRGIVEPVDAMDNEPWSQDLLDWLAYDFVENGYNIKRLLSIMLTSQTYQLPSVSVKEPEMLMTKDFVFSGMIRRRLSAEQFADAVSAALSPLYGDSMIVYNVLPASVKENIPFTRASLIRNDPFLVALGRPGRETVTTSRSSQANLIQALELTNGYTFNQGIRRAAEKWQRDHPDPALLVTSLYRKTLGRTPLKDERVVAMNALGQKPSQESIQDLMWAMMIHPEFQLIY
jgi:mono/diheme cytochrome c family protein